MFKKKSWMSQHLASYVFAAAFYIQQQTIDDTVLKKPMLSGLKFISLMASN